MITHTPHYDKISGSGRWNWFPLNMTGRWMLSIDPEHDEIQMFIEHKGWLFTHWIHENRIEMRPIKTDIIFSGES